MQAISLDVGTSGIRAQLLEVETRKVLRTVITSHNPLPGANVMDHLDFAIERGTDLAREVLLCAVHKVISTLAPACLERLTVCGNPIQLSLLEGIEVRDLAYAGRNFLESRGIVPPDRRGHSLPGDVLGLPPKVEVIIPPAIRHEVGADALAMMIKSGFLDDDMCMVTDYGTNAEMAIKVGDKVLTGSAAAGPAMEGQQISAGMLASPGAISDLVPIPEGWRALVLNEVLEPYEGSMLSLRGNTLKLSGRRARGITGTGVIAVVYAGLETGRIVLPRIIGEGIALDRNVKFTTLDLLEAGKAIGAVRAGHMTLFEEAGMAPEDLETMYMAGASGTYVDARKAQAVGMVPASAKRLVQIGNTSLELAKDLALDPQLLDRLNAMTKELVAHHVMFASSPTFSDIYVQELAYWTEGMPWEAYERNLSYLNISIPRPPTGTRVTVDRRRSTDIWDVGESLTMIDAGAFIGGSWSCDLCMRCVHACPEEALRYEDLQFLVDAGRCLGTACRRCEEACPQDSFRYSDLAMLRSAGH